jgi:hypothetical protein
MLEIVRLAKQINEGAANHRSKSDWYAVIQKLAGDQRRADETAEQSFTRYVTTESDGRELFAAYKSAGGPDYVPHEPEPAPVAKTDTAYSKLMRLADGIRAEQPELSQATAFAKAFIDPKNKALAEEAKRENLSV